MPFYEYECQSCKFYTEVLQKITDDPLRKCPSCGKNHLKKLVSAPVFRLKGDGWYETDFKSEHENKRNLAGDKESESADSGKGDEAKSADSKSADSKSQESKSTASKPAASSAASRSRTSRAAASSGASRSRTRAPVAKRATPKKKARVAARRKRR